MVKISILAIVTGFAAFVAADNCNQGLTYCGSSLLKKGDYMNQITNELAEKRVDANSHNVNDSLFYCNGGDNGDIVYQSTCPSTCQDAGSGKSDSC